MDPGGIGGYQTHYSLMIILRAATIYGGVASSRETNRPRTAEGERMRGEGEQSSDDKKREMRFEADNGQYILF